MNEDRKIVDLLAEIHKQLTMIATHLEALARVARDEHANLFKDQPGPRPEVKRL